MDISTIPLDFWITIATIVATIIIGQLTKKFTDLETKQIPLQNLAIGIIVCIIQYAITKDINTAVALSGIMSGGIYDAGKAIKEIFSKGEN